MSRALDDLSNSFQPLAYALIARCVGRGLAVLITDTLRTVEEQEAFLAAGTSGTRLSRHLPRRLRWPLVTPPAPKDAEKADAMDLVPYSVYQLHGPDKAQWDTKDPAWGIIGEEAEKLGLRWGGRWRDPFDPGHVELVLPWLGHYLAEERGRPWPTFRV